jgi:hypothetical protein
MGASVIEWRRGRTVILVGSAVLAAAYGAAAQELRLVVDGTRLDGVAWVLLGLYTCSHPAANAIDALFYARGGVGRLSWSVVAWAALNLLALFVGWFAIATGVRHLVG